VSASTTFAPVMRSPLHRAHERAGATFALDEGWEYAASYPDPAAVERATAQAVAVADVSARGKIDLRGDLGGLFTRIARTSEGWEPGQLVPIEPAPSEEHPGLIAPISAVWAILFCPPASLDTRLEELEEPPAGSAMVTEVSSQYSGIALTGPRAFDLLARLTPFDLGELGPGAAVATRALEVTAFLLHRDLEPSVVELWVSSSHARYAWESILELGAGLGAAPVGRDAFAERGWW
jgi:glycine cleavage system aminomethyltransferase T